MYRHQDSLECFISQVIPLCDWVMSKMSIAGAMKALLVVLKMVLSANTKAVIWIRNNKNRKPIRMDPDLESGKMKTISITVAAIR